VRKAEGRKVPHLRLRPYKGETEAPQPKHHPPNRDPIPRKAPGEREGFGGKKKKKDPAPISKQKLRMERDRDYKTVNRTGL